MTSKDETPIICFFKCGISPELELSREYKRMMAKKAVAASPSEQDATAAQDVVIGATRLTRASCADCLWEGAILIKTPEDVDEEILSNAILPFCFPEGIKVYNASTAPHTTYYMFTLTSVKGDKSYVTCVTTYEPFADAARAQEKHQEYLFGLQLVVPVCYCLMSREVCTEFSRAWLLKYIDAGADREGMVKRVLARKKRYIHTKTQKDTHTKRIEIYK